MIHKDKKTKGEKTVDKRFPKGFGREKADRGGFINFQASLVAQLMKNPPAVRETQFWSLVWEDPLEKGSATHSSILAWRISWTV